MTDKEDQITQLVERARTGDQTSMEQLVNHFYGDIFRTVYFRVPSRMDAEDITQEIFMRMVKSLPSLKEIRRFKPWLFRIAINRIRDFHRKKRILSLFGSTPEEAADLPLQADSSDDPSKHIMHKEFHVQFRKFSASLSRWEREVFSMRFLDDLEIKEIVQILEKNENTIKTHLYRALKKLRNHAAFYSLLAGDES